MTDIRLNGIGFQAASAVGKTGKAEPLTSTNGTAGASKAAKSDSVELSLWGGAGVADTAPVDVKSLVADIGKQDPQVALDGLQNPWLKMQLGLL